MKFVLSILLAAAVLFPSAASAEWFEKAFYRDANMRWRSAKIQVEDGVLKAYRKQNLVAEFDLSKSAVEHKTGRKHRTQGAGAVAISGYAILGGVALGTKADEGEVVCRDGDCYTRQAMTGKEAGIIAAVVTGIAAAVAVTKKEVSWVEIADGARSVGIKPAKRDRLRFSEAVKSD